MEATTGSKKLSKLREQLENGVRYLVNEKVMNPSIVKVYLRTADKKLAAEVENMKPIWGQDKVKVILDK